VSAGVGAELGSGSGALAADTLGTAVARAAIGNALTQGVAVVTGLQDHFDWAGVAASAVGAGVGYGVSSVVGPALAGSPMGNFAARALTGLAAGAAVNAMRGGKVSIQQVATDAFGNALGGSFVDMMQQPSDNRGMLNAANQAADPAYYGSAADNSYGDWPDQSAAEDARLGRMNAQAESDMLYSLNAGGTGIGLRLGGGVGLHAGGLRGMDVWTETLSEETVKNLAAVSGRDESWRDEPPIQLAAAGGFTMGGTGVRRDPVVTPDSGEKSILQMMEERGQNNPMSLFNKDPSTPGGAIRATWNYLTGPIERLASIKSQALDVLGSQMQDMDAYSKNPNMSLLGKMAADMTLGHMAYNYALVDSGAPTSLLDVTLAAFGAKPTVSGLYGEMRLGIRALDELSLLGKNTQATLSAYQRAYDDAAVAFQRDLDAGSIVQPAGLNFNTWKGGRIDAQARADMNAFKQVNGMDDLIVNKRLYTPDGIKDYRIPDLLVTSERTAIDGTIGLKTANTPQIKDILSTGKVDRVILVSPGQKPVIITVEQYKAMLKN